MYTNPTMPLTTKHKYVQKTHKGDHSHQLAPEHPMFHLNIDHQEKHNLIPTTKPKMKERK